MPYINRITLTLTALFFVVLTGCEKEFDKPAVRTLPTTEAMTIQQLRDLNQTSSTVRFTSDSAPSIFATVTMAGESGNLYKGAYIQDHTGAIQLRLQNSGGLYEGDSIRLFLKGTVLSKYNEMLQLDSVDVDKNVIKQSTLHTVESKVLNSIIEVTTNYQSQLISLNNVQFIEGNIGQPYADAENLEDKNLYLIDKTGETIIVRTSGYAKFANEKAPALNGTFTGILSQYNSDLQFTIRRTSEIEFTQERFVLLGKDFEDQSITSGGWSQQNVLGNINYETNSQGSRFGDYYCQISNFDNGNSACETWLISPAYDFSSTEAPSFSFQNAYNYSGPALEVYVSKDFTGDATTTTWLKVNANLSSGGFAWTNSGNISIPFKTENVHIAFKYAGSNSDGSTWEIDDIKIND